MKLEKAYSIDIKRKITAEEADILYDKSFVKSKYAFKCPEDNCEAQVTCANLDRLKKLRKRDPYFKAIDQHDDECSIGRAIRDNVRREGKGDNPYGTDKPVIGTVRLNLNTPPVDKVMPTKDENNGGSATGFGTGKGRGRKTGEEREITATRTVSSLVDAFSNNKQLTIELPGQDSIPINDLFVPIDKQDIGDFIDEYRIYYGKAFFNKAKNGQGYIVRFATPLKTNEREILPTFFITNELMDKCSLKKFKKSELDKLSDGKPRTVYLLSEVSPVLNWSEDYINFQLEALHYMDCRE
tara:strand:- start:9217 stop:10107 length:891 start_codon:yes stop_codon:yes gene_type:complete